MRQIVISRRQYNQNETTYKPVFSFGRKILKTKMFSLILQKNCYYLTIYSKPKKKWNTSQKRVANNFLKKKGGKQLIQECLIGTCMCLKN